MDPSNERSSAERPNTIGLGQRHLNELLDILDGCDEPAGALLKRKYARWSYRLLAVTLRIEHPGGSVTECAVATRNLSAGGISLLHSSFVFPGSKCTVEFHHPRDGLMSIPATVSSCSHISGVVHELGVQFHELIKVCEFLECGPFDECFSLEKIDPARLRGRVLLVSPTELDHVIVTHFLQHTGVRLTTVKSAEEALAEARQGFDVILSALHMEDVSGADLVQSLRDAEVHTPTILMSADKSPRARLLLRDARPNAFLAKPLTDKVFLCALAEFLVVGSNREDASGAAMAGASELTDSVVGEMVKLADQLADDDTQRCQILALEAKGTAPCFGFTIIASAAGAAAEALTSTHSIELSKAALTDLVMACRQAHNSAA